jgi:indole-3-glycerol phosphate synthase
VRLDDWKARKREELGHVPRVEARNITPSTRDFLQAVGTQRGSLAVIAEIARATPDEGHLTEELDIADLRAAMDEASVSAIAVATDAVVCLGTLSELTMVAHGSTTPVLMHDLILSREQVYQARLAGADAVLLHAGALPAPELRTLLEIATSMHMAAPIEVASEEQLQMALAAGARAVVIPAFGRHDEPSLAIADALLPKVDKAHVAIVRGPFFSPQEFEPLRGRADAIWICGPLMRAGHARAFLVPFVQAAEGA